MDSNCEPPLEMSHYIILESLTVLVLPGLSSRETVVHDWGIENHALLMARHILHPGNRISSNFSSDMLPVIINPWEFSFHSNGVF